MIWEVTVAGRVLRTTVEHPFWVRGRGWTAAKELQGSDELRSHDGQWLAVEAVRDTGREEAVYNCRVAEYHTYFVGDAAWGWSLWAHNNYAPEGVDNLIRNVGDDVTKWLGKDAKVIINEFGDTLVESADRLRQIRFDFNHPHPHKNPHIHLIEYKWVKNKKVEMLNRRIYPQGVTPE